MLSASVTRRTPSPRDDRSVQKDGKKIKEEVVKRASVPARCKSAPKEDKQKKQAVVNEQQGGDKNLRKTGTREIVKSHGKAGEMQVECSMRNAKRCKYYG